MWIDLALIVASALVIAAGIARATRRPARFELRDENTPTVLQRPSVNPKNATFVQALYAASAGIEASSIRVSGGLRDIARAVQLATEPVDQKLKHRTATFVEEFASDVRRESIGIGEA